MNALTQAICEPACEPAVSRSGRQGDATASTGVARTTAQALLSLLDQAVVSGTSLLTTMVIARFGSKEELGAYSVAFAIVLLIIGVHESLIATPYTIYGCRR